MTQLRSLLYLCLFCLPFGAQGQFSAMPEWAEGEANWDYLTREVPAFNPTDAVLRIVRRNGLGKMFDGEGLPRDYQGDFHFLDLNGDAYLDVIYSGETDFRKGAYTIVFSYDPKTYDYSPRYESQGYVSDLRFRDSTLLLTLRYDGYKSNYLGFIRRTALNFSTGEGKPFDQVLFLGQGTPGSLKNPRVGQLIQDGKLRSGPEEQDIPLTDHNLDGEPDAPGNVLAIYPAGSKMIALEERPVKGGSWSFVLMMEGKPAPGHILYHLKEPQTYVAGWIRTDNLLLK